MTDSPKTESPQATCAWCSTPVDVTQPWTRTPPRCRRCASRQEAQRVRVQLMRAQRANVTATLTLEQWLATLDALGWACAYCRGSFDLLDHVIPLDEQGGSTVLNCVPACRACNAAQTHATPRRAEVARLLVHLHAAPTADQQSLGTATANALALRYVFVYLNALRQGLGITQDALAQRSGVPVRGLQRYLRQPPDALPSAATFLRLIAVVGADGTDMGALLAPGATREYAIILAERRLIARLEHPAPEQRTSTFNDDLLLLLHTLRNDATLFYATRALVAGWEMVQSAD